MTSHSNYLAIMTGPHSDIKTAVVDLLLSLSPASCNVDLIPVLLSSYTASLQSSDRLLLTLLSRYESMAGVELSPYQPLVWGSTAVQHYNNNNSSAWSQIKCSEILGLLDPAIMRRTCDKFPLYLQLDPEAEVDNDSIEDATVYDPRFLLPVLSYLLTSDVFIDKHMKFLEVGALNLAFSSLSSKDHHMRSAGYHVLAKLNSALLSAKLNQEKQIWTHVISLLRLGVVTSNLTRGGRVSSLITQYLCKTVDTLLSPVSPMYKTVSKSILAKPYLELGTIPEFQRLIAGDKTELRWLLENISVGVRDSRDYSVCARSNMVKLLCCIADGRMVDRAECLLVMDIILACVTTNYGCVDLVTRHGVLTWCQAVVTREKVDIAYIRKIITITKTVVETAARIDNNKMSNNATAEGQDDGITKVK